MEQRSAHLRTALLTLLAPVSWGTTYITVAELLPSGRPLFVAAIRVLPAGLLLAGGAAFAARWRPRGREWMHTALLATFNFGIFFPLLIMAIHRLPGGVAASVGGVQPLLVAVVSLALGVSRPRTRDLAVGVVAVVGVALVVLRPSASFDPVGVAAALGANMSFAVGVVLTKKLPAPGHRVGATGWQLLIGAFLLVPIALVVEGVPPTFGAANVAGAAYLSLLATGGAFVLWFGGIRRLPTQAPPLLGLAAPVTGATLGWVVLGEDLTLVQLSGFLVTISAIVYGATVGARSGDVSPVRQADPSQVRPDAPIPGACAVSPALACVGAGGS